MSRRPIPLPPLFAAICRHNGCARICLSALLLVAICPSAAFAQYHFDSWTAENGLPQNSVWSIRQTRDGYLWLTTENGLIRFDGVRLTIFNNGVDAGIAGARFNAL